MKYSVKIGQTMEHVLTESGIYQCYAQAATQDVVPLFTAQHVNLSIPQVMRNTNCSRINVWKKNNKKVSTTTNVMIAI